jgi:hypothetical protein
VQQTLAKIIRVGRWIMVGVIVVNAAIDLYVYGERVLSFGIAGKYLQYAVVLAGLVYMHRRNSAADGQPGA